MNRSVDLNHFDILKKFFGFDQFKGNQEDIIKSVLEGKDTFVLMPTGGGKSLCYQLPSLMLDGTAIVISPLIALMKNQVDAMRAFGEDEGVAHFLNSSLNKTQIAQVKRDVLSGATKLLYVAPESLNKKDNIDFLQGVNISFYAIDEAHCISEWGHDFRPEYRRIRPLVNEIGSAPIIALTATATPKVQMDIQKTLTMQNARVFKSSFRRHNLYYEVRPKVSVDKEIIKIIKANQGKSGIVYCLSRKKVEELAQVLQVNGIKSLPYHAGLDGQTRSQNQDKFLMEEVDVIVATIAFGMGIDKPDVRFVIHYDVPKSLEGYYQETGRAGRDGGEGKCIAFYNQKDVQKLEKFMQGKPVAEQEIGKQLLLETVSYCESTVCRPKQLLSYFGEEMHETCNHCDNCINPKEQFEGQEYVEQLLKAISAVKEKFKTNYLTDFLTGRATDEIKAYQHQSLDEFGSGKGKDGKFWNAVVRQSMIAKLIQKDIEHYGLLYLTDRGRAYLKNPKPFLLTKHRDFDVEDAEQESAILSTGAADKKLSDMLKDLRRNLARKHNLPPYVIFQDPSIEDMATQYPVTLEEMQNIVGVGIGKARRYGKEFIALIKLYVEENDILRPQDMVVRSVVNKSVNKVFIIQGVDRKMPLSDIADSKGMTLIELITELEAIVNSGTKLALEYSIDQMIDPERQGEVFEFFREVEEDAITEAMEEFDEDEYSEEELRLLHVRFMSEMGN